MSKEIKMIPAKTELQEEKILRVAAYCRVSTDHEEQKTYVEDFLTHKQEKNNGVVQQFILQRSHEAIIPKELFGVVQCTKTGNIMI